MTALKKKLIPFRLWEGDIEKLKAKIVIDKTNMQKVLELLVKMYLEDGEEIMKRVKTISKEKNAQRRRYNSFDELETDMLYQKIAEVSPLAEMDRMLKEIQEKK